MSASCAGVGALEEYCFASQHEAVEGNKAQFGTFTDAWRRPSLGSLLSGSLPGGGGGGDGLDFDEAVGGDGVGVRTPAEP